MSAAAGSGGASDTAAIAMTPAVIAAESRRTPVGRTLPSFHNVIPKLLHRRQWTGPELADLDRRWMRGWFCACTSVRRTFALFV
ncbi:hypothetical protein Mro03_67650 [Microbispora rosea subsp. rosea]|nr:hypothetical protein Mro03_67650 [Microbispora rosea subsp. rosea]